MRGCRVAEMTAYEAARKAGDAAGMVQARRRLKDLGVTVVGEMPVGVADGLTVRAAGAAPADPVPGVPDGRERRPGEPPNEHLTTRSLTCLTRGARENIAKWTANGEPTVTLFACEAQALAGELDRLVAFLRAEAAALTGKALYHPEHYLNRLADDLEANGV